MGVSWPGMPLNSPCRDFVTRWNGGLPTRPEWALAPDRGALGYQTGSWVSHAWPSGVCVAPGCGNYSPWEAWCSHLS